MQNMKKSDLVKIIARKNPYFYLSDVDRVVTTILNEITESLSRGDRVELRGFGVFSTRTRKARAARNPKTGESVMVSQKSVPFFKAGKNLKKRINI